VLHPNLVLASDDERANPEDDDSTVDVNELLKRFAQDSEKGENAFAQKALENLDIDDADSECPLCLDVMQSPMIIPECMHRL
jgi:DNA repair protein RAD5